MNITQNGAFTWSGMKSIPYAEYTGKENFGLEHGDVLFNNTNSKELVGKTCLVGKKIEGGFSNHITRIRVKNDTCLPEFLVAMLHGAWQRGAFLERSNQWIGQAGINTSSLSTFRVPLPPLEVQREIVSEIDGYQKVIDGARAVVENWRPRIAVDPEWPVVELGEVARVIAGQSPPGISYNTDGVGEPFYQGKTEFGNDYIGQPVKWTTDPRRFAEVTDILMSVRAPVGPVNLTNERVCIGRGLAAIRPANGRIAQGLRILHVADAGTSDLREHGHCVCFDQHS